MSSIVKSISIFDTESSTRSNSAYAVPSFSMPWLYTAANYDGTVAVYFEAVLSVNSGGTAYAELRSSGGSSLGEVSTTNTTATRLRSSDIFSSLVDGNTYQVRIKSSVTTTYTTTITAARIIIVQSGTVTKTETVYSLGSNNTTTSTSYADDTNKAGYFWDSDRFDNATTYFEAFLSPDNSANTAYANLHDGSGAVTSSEVTLTGTTTDTRVRSGAITLTDNKVHKVNLKASAGTTRVRAARVVIVQSATITKTESYYPIKMSFNTASNSAEQSNGLIYWDADEWDVSARTVIHEAWMASNNNSDTASTDLNDGTNDDDIRTTTSTTKMRDLGIGLTLDDNTTYDNQVRNSDASSSSFYGALLRIRALLSVSGTYIRSASNNSDSTGTAMSVAAPPGTSTGDVVIISVHGNGQTTIADNNGATSFTADLSDYKPNTTGGHTVAIYSRRIQGGDPTTYNFILGASGRWSITAIAIANPHATDIYDVAPSSGNAANTDNSAAATIDAPTITTTTANAIHVACGYFDDGTAGLPLIEAGYADEASANNQPQVMGTKLIAAAGATGACTFTGFTSSPRIALSFAIKAQADAVAGTWVGYIASSGWF